MQKSALPKGTVFIAVGATLGALGACVIGWRAMIAWTVNRSARRAAIQGLSAGSDAKSGWGGHGNKRSSGIYKDVAAGSTLSLDALTSSGKPLTAGPRPKKTERASSPNTSSALFFSPTAGPGMQSTSNRSSTYLPAGYYASPSAQAAGGAQNTTIGGLSAGYRPSSHLSPSPPVSPGLPPTSRDSLRPGAGSPGRRVPSRSTDGHASSSRDSFVPASRDGPVSGQNSTFGGSALPAASGAGALYSQPSSSSLMVGLGGSGVGGHDDRLPGSRAPSTYLDDLFESHGAGPRERF
ncbi:hypothetical protein LTR28_009268 [Elasticomyces elasticus]|nr:hypothetical protein LTR28_009268 [Elasticomyces elasticus]